MVRRIAQGERAAVTALYEATRRRVYGICLAVLRDVMAAEEATLDVYVQVWKKAAEYSPERGSVDVWLSTIARTRAIDLLRARARRRRGEEALDAAAPVVDPTADLLRLAARSERAEAVRHALLALPENERRPLMIAYYTGRSYAETAAFLGLPEGTVKTRIRHALMRLGETLAAFTGEIE